MYNLWDEKYFLNLAQFKLNDDSLKIEARINKIKIKARYESTNEPVPQYSFDIEEWSFHAIETDLFATKEEAKKEAERRISKIEILVSEDFEKKKPVWPTKPE